jgi:hypothetical protein
MNKSAPRLSVVVTLACLAGFVATGFARAEASNTIAPLPVARNSCRARVLNHKTFKMILCPGVIGPSDQMFCLASEAVTTQISNL